MVYGIYQSAAGLQLNQYRQAVLANNLANVDTTGFKEDFPVVRERRVARWEDVAHAGNSDPMLDKLTGGSLVAPTFTSHAQGPLQETRAPLDVAIEGEGYFAVLDGQQTKYTRDGRFTLNKEGQLVTAAGYPVLSDQGKPITVPRDAASQLSITAGGEVRSGQTSFGRLDVVGFDDESLLRKTGGNLFESLGAQEAKSQAALRPGFLEGSTVEPTRAMVSLIQVSRAYEVNATLVGLADSTLSRAVNDIARLR